MADMTYQEQLDHLAGLIAAVYIDGGGSSPRSRCTCRTCASALARVILDAGYRRVADPRDPIRGECRACAQIVPLTPEGLIDRHPDLPAGRGDCLGSRLTPAKVVTDG